MAMMSFSQLSAQESAVDDHGIFNHLSVGVGVGLTGISIEAAAPITPYVTVRGGVNIFPQIKVKTDLDLDGEIPASYNGPRSLRALKNYRYFHFIGVVRRHYRAFTRRSGYDVW